MNPRLFAVIALLLSGSISNAQSTQVQQPKTGQNTQEPDYKTIDFERARVLRERRRNGEKLNEEDAAFVKLAEAAFTERQRNQPQSRNTRPAMLSRDKTGLVPLSDMTKDDRYQGEDGGLYGNGWNTPPKDLQQAADAALLEIQPLDREGKADKKGQIVFISISMSNATQEFSRFKQIADQSPSKSKSVTIVDCAQGGQAMAEWVPADGQPWRETDRRIQSAGVSSEQVQVAWIKLANKSPSGTLSQHARQLEKDTVQVIQNAKTKFPNLRVVYLSSRIYAGYANNHLNPEPFAYESAFACRWLIQDQMKHTAHSPVILWGPYLWADGISPRIQDKLTYFRDDLGPDGTHPSPTGRNKVAGLMLQFFSEDPLAKSWFAN